MLDLLSFLWSLTESLVQGWIESLFKNKWEENSSDYSKHFTDGRWKVTICNGDKCLLWNVVSVLLEIQMEGYFIMHWISRGFQKNMNSDLSVPGIPGIDKSGVFVVITIFSWSHRCSLQRASDGLESKECCRVWTSSTSFSSYLLAAARFAVCQTPIVQVTRNCVMQGCWCSHGLLQAQSCPAVTCSQAWGETSALPGVCGLVWLKGRGGGPAKWSYGEGDAGGAVWRQIQEFGGTSCFKAFVAVQQ